MAAVTERLRFATMVYILPLRHPLEVAKATASVAALAGGRLALGVGAGWMREEFDALGVDFDSRGARMDESIDVLRALWRGGMVEHHGRVFDFERLQISPAPPAPIPVWIGGASAPALRRAARVGEGWMGSGNGVAEAAALLARLRDLRAQAGRERLPFEAIVPLTEPADADALRRLEDAGMTGAVSYPFLYALGPTSSLDEKRRLLERYAGDVIAKAR
jgi:probable F420-dependent oxidoreductase